MNKNQIKKLAEFKNQYVKSFIEKTKQQLQFSGDIAFLYLGTSLYSNLDVNEVEKFITDAKDDKKN